MVAPGNVTRDGQIDVFWAIFERVYVYFRVRCPGPVSGSLFVHYALHGGSC